MDLRATIKLWVHTGRVEGVVSWVWTKVVKKRKIKVFTHNILMSRFIAKLCSQKNQCLNTCLSTSKFENWPINFSSATNLCSRLHDTRERLKNALRIFQFSITSIRDFPWSRIGSKDSSEMINYLSVLVWQKKISPTMQKTPSPYFTITNYDAIIAPSLR